MIIEFVGLPGAGKTTIVRSLINRGMVSEQANFVDGNNLKRCGKGEFIRALFRREESWLWRAIWAAMQCGGQVRPLNGHTFRLFLTAVYLAYSSSRLKRHTKDPLLYDQHIVQCVWSAVFTNAILSPRKVEKLLRAIKNGRPDLMVWVNIDHIDAINRIQGRATNNSRLDRMDRETAEANLAKMKCNLRTFYSLAVEAWGCSIIELDASSLPEENVAVILKALEPCGISKKIN